MTTPANDAATSTMSRRSTRSPNHRAAARSINTGESAPMIVAFAALVSENALKVKPMSAAKKTPPSAQARIVAAERR